LHGGTSISWTSPPSYNFILNLLSVPCQGKTKRKGLMPNLPPFSQMFSEYYEYRGWSEEGVSTPEKLKELGLVKGQAG
jgi:aldehyde:ferredoxin oxidoreductase